MPFPQLRVLGLLADDRVFHDRVAEVIHHRRDGEDTPQPLIQTFLRRGLLSLRGRGIRPRQTILLLVIEAEIFDAIAHLLSDGDRLRSEHDLPPGCEVAEHWMAPGLDRFPATSAGRRGTRVEATPPALISVPPGLSGGPLFTIFSATRVADDADPDQLEGLGFGLVRFGSTKCFRVFQPRPLSVEDGFKAGDNFSVRKIKTEGSNRN